jgi:hypothetical protein
MIGREARAYALDLVRRTEAVDDEVRAAFRQSFCDTQTDTAR